MTSIGDTTEPTAAEHDHVQRQAPVRVLAAAVAVLCALIVWLAWYAWQLSADAAAARRAADAVAAQSKAQTAALAEAQSRTREALCATILDSLADEIPTPADAQLRASYARLSCPTPLPTQRPQNPSSTASPGTSTSPSAGVAPPNGPGGRVTQATPSLRPQPASPRPSVGPSPVPLPAPTPSCIVNLLGVCL